MSKRELDPMSFIVVGVAVVLVLGAMIVGRRTDKCSKLCFPNYPHANLGNPCVCDLTKVVRDDE